MERPESAARRRTLDLPTKPESGLAEWTSKIKALQRQVDEDEETEQKRLEQEIAASRAARLRRSAGYGSRANSVDLPQAEFSELSEASTAHQRANSPETPASPADKQRDHDDALRKLMGANYPVRDRPPPSPRATSAAAPMSLAAFMGGHATGPRLTKQAPQQDAHDPTQFEQRTHITAPHPIFGRGGIAMPGMAGRGTSSTQGVRDQHFPVAVEYTSERDRKLSTPSVGTPTLPKIGGDVNTGFPSPARDRTISTPTVATSVRNTPSPRLYEGNSTPAKPTTPVLHTPNSFVHTVTSDVQPPTKYSSPPAAASPIRRSQSTVPTTSLTSSLSSSPKSPKPSITTPSLARPIQPTPRHSLGPSVPPSHNPSPAFLRAPAPKEPTPSISRLQGRGFVQSVVKASSQLEGNSATPPSPSFENRDSGGRKNSSVLERWQFGAEGSSPRVSAPAVSPKPAPARKTWTADPPQPAAVTSTPIKPLPTGKPTALRSMASLPTLPFVTSHRTAEEQQWDKIADRPGLGSSTTTVAYIKPTKTGDEPVVPVSMSRSHTPSPAVDELGVRVKTRSVERESPSAGVRSSSPGKPLSHPTKDRAKKPRKQKSVATSVIAKPTIEKSAETVPSDRIRQVATVNTSEVIRPQQPSKFPSTASLPPAPEPSSTNTPFVRYTGGVIQPLAASSAATRPGPTDSTPKSSAPSASRNLQGIRQPLPGLAIQNPNPPVVEKTPSPVRHSRIPSTGNRATVMDVAQVFQEHTQTDAVSERATPKPSDAIRNDIDRDKIDNSTSRSHVDLTSTDRGSHNGAHSVVPVEKRKSSYEKYSAFVMPPLKEETPVPSPAGTLSRAEGRKMQSSDASTIHVNESREAPQLNPQSESIQISRTAHNIPKVDVKTLLDTPRPSITPDPDVRTISVDVMVITGNTASALSRDTHVFYDSEILAIIHRMKAQSTGLVSTRVWAWHGARCRIGEREERKLQELAKRYGTTLINVYQYSEPLELVSVLGGQIAARQGTRAHWSSENTAMHVTRSFNGAIFIDELDLSIKNLCSGFSYCLTLLGSVFVWYGCGSRDDERTAALNYAKTLSSNTASVVELSEGENDNDEMFWMILGEGQYAKADYWKWKRQATIADPRVWAVDTKRAPDAVYTVASFLDDARDESVYIIDCVWEYFVLVGSKARAKRTDIYLALTTGLEMSKLAASSRPFTPPVHALILPTQIPTDLLLTFRDLDEVQLNDGNVPDHMNLITAHEGLEQLVKTTWEKDALRDTSMLPLGVDSSDLI